VEPAAEAPQLCNVDIGQQAAGPSRRATMRVGQSFGPGLNPGGLGPPGAPAPQAAPAPPQPAAGDGHCPSRLVAPEQRNRELTLEASKRSAITIAPPPLNLEALVAGAGSNFTDPDLELPVLYGYMYKKSPGKFRIKAWDWRFFVICDCKVIWWKDKESCIPEGRSPGPVRRRASTDDIIAECAEAERNPRMRGMINFNVSPAQIQANAMKSSVFTVGPMESWAEGATTDKDQDDKRVYTFDVTSSGIPRDKWMNTISRHINEGRDRYDRKSTSAVSEYWEDDTISADQAAAAARLVARLEARRARNAV